jgi:probable HAF family extracellular repeat protein
VDNARARARTAQLALRFATWLVACAGIGAVALASPVNSAPETPGYTIESIGRLGGEYAYAFGINRSTQVVGYSQWADFRVTGFRWDRGVMTPLIPPNTVFSESTAINDLGQVVGIGSQIGAPTPTGTYSDAYFWDGSSFQFLPRFDAPVRSINSQPYGLNNLGDVVGQIRTGSEVEPGSAFSWRAGAPLRVRTVEPDSRANDVNDGRQIVGYVVDSTGRSRAVVWQGDVGESATLRVLPDLQTGGSSSARGIHNNGLIVGSSWFGHPAFGTRPVLWSSSGITDLGTLGGNAGDAYDVNADGVVVGEAADQDRQLRAFVWKVGIMWDLNELIPANSGWRLQRATGINDDGIITGWGSHNFRTEGFVLTPGGPPVERQAYSDLVLDDRPVGYWRLGDVESGSIADSSGHGRTGRIVGSILDQPDGAIVRDRVPDSAAFFGGGHDGYIAVSNVSGIPTGGSPYTLEAWVNISTDYVTNSGILGFGAYGEKGRANALRTARTLGFVNYWWGIDQVVTGLGDISGAWHHLVASFDGTARRMYVDGALVAMAGSRRPDVASTELRLGQTCCNEHLNGSLDEVAIYDHALSQERVALHNNVGRGLGPLTAAATTRNRAAVRTEILTDETPTVVPSQGQGVKPAPVASPSPSPSPSVQGSPRPAVVLPGSR